METNDVSTPLPLLRSSERTTFMRCPQLWYWSYVEGLTPVQEKKAAADFGTLFHIALAEYYKPGLIRGVEPAETWDKLAKEMVATIKTEELQNDELVSTWEDFHQLGLDLAVAYVDRYQGDPHWNVLDAERRFAVTIPDVRYPPQLREGKRGYRPICTMVGTFDLCIRDLNDDQVKMVDHKTMGRIYTNHLTLDPQASTYLAVGTKALRDQKLIGANETIKGMEYNFIKRAKLDTRPRDENGQARNKPTKKHYIEAIMACEQADFPDDPTNYKEAELLKWSVDQLATYSESLCLTVYGEVSKDQSSDNFSRLFVPRTPKERQQQIVRISQEAQTMQRIIKGEIPLLKNTNKECYWCKFFDLCELDEAGEDTTYFKDTAFKKYDPYADHRPSAINSKKVEDGSEAQG